ncbi:thermopsin [Nanobdella aerobiophila]|uniref:Thermopsin n=1 Tax=Nanobdella aerobiophila TaxID=2586965 RepID=A0A915SF74_9ARCH|nr:thermopsin [Nanobdella aerobiophila]BBL45525.1 thermopsin [Nanobdella aerobiophila]
MKYLRTVSVIIMLIFLYKIFPQQLFGYNIQNAPSNYFQQYNLPQNTTIFSLENPYGSSYNNIFELLSNYYEYYNISINSPEYLDLNLISNNPIQFYVMTDSNYYDFEYGYNFSYIYYYDTNNLDTQLYLNQGNYYIVIDNNGYSNSFVQFLYSLTQNPINPYRPIGIADLGINSNNLEGYTYTTNEFIGQIYINNISGSVDQECDIGPYASNDDSESIQLNVMLVDNTYNGLQYYWLQNVLQINNTGGYYYFEDNVWNGTSSPSLLNNNSIYGSGAVYFSNLNNGSYYVYSTYGYNLSYPLNAFLIINITQNNSYPEIQFGYSFDGQNIIWYDNVTIYVPSINYSIVVEPYQTPEGASTDAELVVSGPYNSYCTYINNINAYLSLYFLYDYNGQEYLSPVENFFNYGISTAESVSNVNVNSLNYGSVELSTGSQDIGQLTPGNYYELFIYYPNNGSSYVNYYPYGQTVNLDFPNSYYISPYYRMFLDGINANGQNYNSNYLSFTMNQNYYIIPNYILQDLVNIYSPFQFYLDGNYYSRNISIWENNGTILNIYLNNINQISNNERYYCQNNTLQFYIDSPTSIYLLDYCNFQYLINIYSPFSYYINNNYYDENASLWFNNGSTINIYFNNINQISNNERYYCQNNNIDININNPENLNLSNYCSIQDLININTPFLINITFSNGTTTTVGNTSFYLNYGDSFKIDPTEYKYLRLFTNTIYYEDGESVFVNGSQNITIQFNQDIEINNNTYYFIFFIIFVAGILIFYWFKR